MFTRPFLLKRGGLDHVRVLEQDRLEAFLLCSLDEGLEVVENAAAVRRHDEGLDEASRDRLTAVPREVEWPPAEAPAADRRLAQDDATVPKCLAQRLRDVGMGVVHEQDPLSDMLDQRLQVTSLRREGEDQVHVADEARIGGLHDVPVDLQLPVAPVVGNDPAELLPEQLDEATADAAGPTWNSDNEVARLLPEFLRPAECCLQHGVECSRVTGNEGNGDLTPASQLLFAVLHEVRQLPSEGCRLAAQHQPHEEARIPGRDSAVFAHLAVGVAHGHNDPPVAALLPAGTIGGAEEHGREPPGPHAGEEELDMALLPVHEEHGRRERHHDREDRRHRRQNESLEKPQKHPSDSPWPALASLRLRPLPRRRLQLGSGLQRQGSRIAGRLDSRHRSSRPRRRSTGGGRRRASSGTLKHRNSNPRSPTSAFGGRKNGYNNNAQTVSLSYSLGATT